MLSYRGRGGAGGRAGGCWALGMGGAPDPAGPVTEIWGFAVGVDGPLALPITRSTTPLVLGGMPGDALFNVSCFTAATEGLGEAASSFAREATAREAGVAIGPVGAPGAVREPRAGVVPFVVPRPSTELFSPLGRAGDAPALPREPPT
jgi:hypothetical protein